MQNALHENQVGYGRSPELWKNFPDEDILVRKDRNVGIGFYDDFESFHASTLEGPHILLEGGGCSIEQIASVADAYGQVKMAIDGNAANDEVVMARGRGIDALFKLNADTCFEARIKVSAITAAKWSWFLGLAGIGAAVTDQLFTDTTGALYASLNFLGFQKLAAEGGAVDGMYQADGETKQDGAAKTKLDTLHTMVADTYVKLGLRYNHVPRSLHWFVNGTEVSSSKLTATELDADTFPDDVFLTPTFGAKDVAGNAALNLTIDWWAGAQAF